MAAWWSDYFSEEGPLSIDRSGAKELGGILAARAALHATLEWLRDNGRQVIMIGPVPVYEKSVPLGQALQAAKIGAQQHSTGAHQRLKNAPFFDAVQALNPGDWFRFPDPIQWMCADDCLVMFDGVPLYRDSNHLSLAGAMALETHIFRGLITTSFDRVRTESVSVNMNAIGALSQSDRSSLLSK